MQPSETTYLEATEAQGPGVGAESANAGGMWGGQSPPIPILGALGPNNGLIRPFKGILKAF